MARYCRTQPQKPLTRPMVLTFNPVTSIIRMSSVFRYQAVRFRRPPVMKPLTKTPWVFNYAPVVPPGGPVTGAPSGIIGTAIFVSGFEDQAFESCVTA